MYYLVLFKPSANMFFHYKSMLTNISPLVREFMFGAKNVDITKPCFVFSPCSFASYFSGKREMIKRVYPMSWRFVSTFTRACIISFMVGMVNLPANNAFVGYSGFIDTLSGGRTASDKLSYLISFNHKLIIIRNV